VHSKIEAVQNSHHIKAKLAASKEQWKSKQKLEQDSNIIETLQL
jgi:hypothetical protein